MSKFEKMISYDSVEHRKLVKFSELSYRINFGKKKYMKKKYGWNELYGKKIDNYKPVDPIVEAGLVATLRQLIGDGEKAQFNAVANIVKRVLKYEKDILDIKKLSKELNEIKKTSNEVFYQYAYIDHLHSDIEGQRYDSHMKAKRSCLGPATYNDLCSLIFKVCDLSQKLNKRYVEKLLATAGQRQ